MKYTKYLPFIAIFALIATKLFAENCNNDCCTAAVNQLGNGIGQLSGSVNSWGQNNSGTGSTGGIIGGILGGVSGAIGSAVYARMAAKNQLNEIKETLRQHLDAIKKA